MVKNIKKHNLIKETEIIYIDCEPLPKSIDSDKKDISVKSKEEEKLSNETFGGELGGIAATIDQILRSPFGKKDEAFSDFKGADLSIVSGFNVCEIVNLWDRMASNSNSNSTFDEFLSSHPFPSKRRDCLRNHISVNYNINCN